MIDYGRRWADYKIIAASLMRETIRAICFAVVAGALAWAWFGFWEI